MTLLRSRIWLTISLVALQGCALSRPSLHLRVYRLRPDGLHRGKEVVPLEKAYGSYVMCPADFEQMVLRGELDQETQP